MINKNITPPVKFSARLFITESFPGQDFKRDQSLAIFGYKQEFSKHGITISAMEFVKYGKAGRHDHYATGWHYDIKGEIVPVEKTVQDQRPKLKAHTKAYWTFQVFHHARVDYFNAYPITLTSIKIII